MTKNPKDPGRLKEDQTTRHPGHETRLTELRHRPYNTLAFQDRYRE